MYAPAYVAHKSRVYPFLRGSHASEVGQLYADGRIIVYNVLHIRRIKISVEEFSKFTCFFFIYLHIK